MDDHKRGCQGREYTCTCGYDEQQGALREALAKAEAERDDERTRCANIASHFMGSLWSADQNHVASLIFNEISHPTALSHRKESP